MTMYGLLEDERKRYDALWDKHMEAHRQIGSLKEQVRQLTEQLEREKARNDRAA